MEQTRTAGPARPSLLKMTWPVFIELLLQMLVGNIDQIMLSRYNDTAGAAVGNAKTGIKIPSLTSNGISQVPPNLVSQYLGGRRGRTVWQG